MHYRDPLLSFMDQSLPMCARSRAERQPYVPAAQALRPGALDYRRVPSLVAGERVAYADRSGALTGPTTYQV